jgi:lipopolysaccharide export system protein LptA
MKPRRALLLLALGACLAAAGHAADAPAAKPTPPPVETVVQSDEFDMVSSAKETTFTYRRNVRVTATNMTLTCDNLVIVARRSGDPALLIGKQERLKSLVATGKVRIVQDDREATAERAEVLPDDDKVILTGNPVVRGVKDGWEQRGDRMELYRGERRAVIPSNPRTVLPALKDLGYDRVPERKKPAEPNAASATPPKP